MMPLPIPPLGPAGPRPPATRARSSLRRWAAAALLALLPAAPAPEPATPRIRATERLADPITQAVTFEGQEAIALISDNGRFVVLGELFDAWSGTWLSTLEQIRATRDRIDLARLDLDPEDLAPLIWGHGPAEVVVFADPLGPETGRLMALLRADPALAGRYRFVLHPLPAPGEDSARAVRALSCAPDRQAAAAALVAGDRRWIAAHPAPAGCDMGPLTRRMILARMIGVAELPFLISPTGHVARGLPPDLAQFLARD